MSKFKPVSITPIIPEKTFRAFVQTVLPTIYDDSLSYYELLNKAVKILNTNTENVAILSENQEKFIEAVTNYINSLEISVVPYDIALNFDVDTFDEMKATIANGGICCIALTDTDGGKNYLYYSNNRYYSDYNQNKMTFNGLSNIKNADDYSENNTPSIITLSLEKVNDEIVVSYNKKYKIATENDVDTAFANAIAISVQTYVFSYNVDSDTLSVSDVTRDIIGAINNNRICVCKVVEENKPDVECYYSGKNSINNAEKLVFVGNIIDNGVCVGTKTVNIDADAGAFIVEGVTNVTDKYYADKDDVIFADFSVTINGNTITLNNASITPLDLLKAKLNNKKVIGRLFDTLAPVIPYQHAYYANSFFCSPISVPENITQNSINFNFIIKIDGNSIVQYLIKSNNNSAWSIEKEELSTERSYVTPEMYGAVGDGENDDTTSVRNALKAAINEGKTLFIPNKYYITQSLLTADDYSTCTIKILGTSPSNREQYSVGAFGGIKFANGINLFDGLTISGSINNASFMPVSRTQTGSIFNRCVLSKFTFDSSFVSNILAFCHNTNVSSTSRIINSTFLTVYYFAKCDEGNKYFTDSIIENCYINGGAEMNDNHCFEWYNWNGSNVTGNFVDYYRTIYSPVLSARGKFQAPVSSSNQYQVFRYFYFVSNVTSFQFQSEADCFNWNDPTTLEKLNDYVSLTYTGRDNVVRDIPPNILLVTEEGAVEINNAVIQNNIGNIVFVRRGLGNYSHSRAKLTCSLRDHRRSYDASVKVADSIYNAGTYRDNLIDIPFAKPVDSLPTIGSVWSINYPGMRVRYNNHTYRYMWIYNDNTWVATWVDEAIGAYKTSMLQNDSDFQTASQVQAAIDAALQAWSNNH